MLNFREWMDLKKSAVLRKDEKNKKPETPKPGVVRQVFAPIQRRNFPPGTENLEIEDL